MKSEIQEIRRFFKSQMTDNEWVDERRWSEPVVQLRRIKTPHPYLGGVG